MTTSALEEQRIEGVVVDDRALTVHLTDGRTLATPLDWYPRLLHATNAQRNDWRLIARGIGIHWPQIDEDLSLAGMLRGVRAPAPHPGPSSISAWARDQQDLQQAQEFFGQSMGRILGQMQSDSAQLQSYMQQLPEESQAQVQQMTDSYSQFEGTINQAAQDAGVEDSLQESAQQARQNADQASGQGPTDVAAGQAQEVAGQAQGAAGQVTDQAGQAANQVQDTAGGLTDQAQDVAGQAIDQTQALAGNYGND